MIKELDETRLIEKSFCLQQTSMDGSHEKLCHSGHIKAFHIWPARRPLAACRAEILATLIPDPGSKEERNTLCTKIGGKITKKIISKKMPNGQIVERVKEETEGGVLHWKRELENSNLLTELRKHVLDGSGGNPPRLIDPFAGGGAIPLEAMRLGCEATAIDINPVAWFILKCTLEYPKKLADKTFPLPDFITDNEDYMEIFYKAHAHLVGRTKKTKRQRDKEYQTPSLFDKPDSRRIPKANLAWQVRAWGQWILGEARKQLAQFYPAYADFEPLDMNNVKPYELKEMRLVPLNEDGTMDVDSLNKEFSDTYLEDKKKPRWVAKPTLAYLWARTVSCKNCRAEVPLLKTKWLCKKAAGRALLSVTPKSDGSGVRFGIEYDVSIKGVNSAQKREHDKKISTGTMSRSGAKCPCCATINTMNDLRLEGKAGKLGKIMYAVAYTSSKGKSFRNPTKHDIDAAHRASETVSSTFEQLPFGIPNDPMPNENALGMRAPKYGFTTWDMMFSGRQLAMLGVFSNLVRKAFEEMKKTGTPIELTEAITAYLACVVDKLADYNSAFVAWQPAGCKGANTFQRWAIPMKWDFTENNVLDSDSGGYAGVLKWVTEPLIGTIRAAVAHAPTPTVIKASSINEITGQYDLIVTDPPYYDAIPYSDCMDFFYVWLRRMLYGLNEEWSSAFTDALSPKWDTEKKDGELIDDANRHDRDSEASKSSYETGMASVFGNCHKVLVDKGRLVIVFAHKDPNAWETLVSAIIHSGFVVDGSWPIQTEMINRTRSIASAALATSVWLVCKKRPITARAGWDNRILDDMRRNITERLRDYWDAGIRGPDFVWAATGPALEAYSKHPIVKKANDPGQLMLVGEFLAHVRRMVVDFVVGQVLIGEDYDSDVETSDRMDAPTAYYLLHRHDFGLEEAPAGACIIYATACGVSYRDLGTTWNLITHKGSEDMPESDGDDFEENSESDAGTESNNSAGNKIQLKLWTQRRSRSMGYEAPNGKPIPLIDRIHCLMHLWKEGNVHKVDDYLDDNGLRRQELFRRLVQSLIELSQSGSDERNILESLSNHVQAKGAIPDNLQEPIEFVDTK